MFLQFDAVRAREKFRQKIPEILDLFADPDKVHRQMQILSRPEPDTRRARCRPAWSYKTGNACGFQKSLRLRQRVLSGRGIQHQKCGVRGVCIELAQHADDFAQLSHQRGI